MSFFEELTRDNVFIIAEVGVNHNGDMDLAKKLIAAAKEVGADAVKFQVFQPSKLCSSIHRAEQLGLLEELMLTNQQLVELKDFAESLGIVWFATPFDEISLEFLVSIDSKLLKVGSGELTHSPLLQKISESNIPTIISSGGFTLKDISRALDDLSSIKTIDVAILHCISQYPAELKNLNLKAMQSIQKEFPNHIVGFSDHSKGYIASVLAASLGARIIEKHITLDNSMPGPDHRASLDVTDFAEFVNMVRLVDKMLGDGVKKREDGENLTGRSIVASCDIEAGRIITPDMLAFKRPGTHLPPYRQSEVLDRKANKKILRDDFINLTDLDIL
ncbi:MAG: N-acetylneuraminate synthase family protein [Methyloprofundus sp.]|nr:N-acetylneuraminate synthase family protein [Methyloprofundus sp.]